MKSMIPLAAVAATFAVLAAAPVLSHAQQDASSASSSSSRQGSGTIGASDGASSSAVAASSSSSPDCPANPATMPAKPKRDPTARTTSSCFNPYVQAPGTSASSSSSVPR